MSATGEFEALGSEPLVKRAHAALLEAILSERVQGKLPNEPRLAEMMQVSRSTLRLALQVLETEGVISRRRASGTVVNSHVSASTLAIQRLVGFEHLLLRGHESSRVGVARVEWRKEKVPEAFVLAHGLAPGMDCVLCEKHYLVDERVALVARDLVPVENVLAEVDLESLPHSLLAFSEQYCVAPIDHAISEFVAVAAAAAGPNATKLNVTAGDAFIRMHETFHTATAEAIAYGILDFDKETKISVFRRRD